MYEYVVWDNAARVIAEGMERLRGKPKYSDQHAIDMISRNLNAHP